MAVMPWGTVLLGMTTTFFSVSAAHCWAAMMMFPLLGRTKTVSAGIWSTPSRMLSVEGFMVCPPDTTPSTPRSWNTAARPSPAQTERKPYFFSGGATTCPLLEPPAASMAASSISRSSTLWAFFPAAMSSYWVRMFSIFASSRVPYFWPSVRALPGMLVWTWTLNASSSSPMTRLSPMLLR